VKRAATRLIDARLPHQDNVLLGTQEKRFSRALGSLQAGKAINQGETKKFSLKIFLFGTDSWNPENIR
jgi:hypothetical protein